MARADFLTEFEKEALHVDREVIERVREKVNELEGPPFNIGTIVKTMHALVALGWDGWPTTRFGSRDGAT